MLITYRRSWYFILLMFLVCKAMSPLHIPPVPLLDVRQKSRQGVRIDVLTASVIIVLL